MDQNHSTLLGTRIWSKSYSSYLRTYCDEKACITKVSVWSKRTMRSCYRKTLQLRNVNNYTRLWIVNFLFKNPQIMDTLLLPKADTDLTIVQKFFEENFDNLQESISVFENHIHRYCRVLSWILLSLGGWI